MVIYAASPINSVLVGNPEQGYGKYVDYLPRANFLDLILRDRDFDEIQGVGCFIDLTVLENTIA